MTYSSWQDKFLDFLRSKPPLPGESAHELVALKGRVKASELNSLMVQPKISAVAVVFEKFIDEYRIVLIKRREYAGVHSAQISFPGGRKEGPESELQASLRELYEELGVKLHADHLLTSLTELYIPPSNFLMYPFAFQVCEPLKIYPDPGEVADVLYLPLQNLTKDPCFQPRKVSVNNFQLSVPAIEIQNHIIWGATAMVLAEVHVLVKKFLSTHP